jgi:hypothetical protein
MHGTGADAREEELHHPAPHSNLWPVAASPKHTDVSMANEMYPQEWSRVDYMQRLVQEFNAVLPDADQSTVSPHFNNDPPASDIHPRASNLGPFVSAQSVNQPFSPGQDFVVDWDGPNSPALPSRVTAQYPLFPPAVQGQRIAGQRSAAEIASELVFLGAGLADTVTDHAMHHGGQGRHGVQAQHAGANINQRAPFVCPVLTCRKEFGKKSGLKYELHAKMLSTPG